MNIKECAKQLKQDIPAVFLTMRDKDTPALAKIIACVAVMYALSPIDLIPDFIPVLGYLDDVLILPALIALTIKLIPNEIWERNRSLSIDMWKDKKPKRWYYAIPIVVIWLLLVWLFIRAVWF